MNRQIPANSTSVIVQVRIENSTSSSGAGLTGLTNASSGLTAYYKRNSASAAVQISLVSMTLGTWVSGGFKEVSSTTMPGVYEIAVPNAAFASGATGVAIVLKGATNMAECAVQFELTATSNQDSANGGIGNIGNINSRTQTLIDRPSDLMFTTSAVSDGSSSTQIVVTDPGVPNLQQLYGCRIRWTSDNIDGAIFNRVITGASYDGNGNIILLLDKATSVSETPSDGDTVLILHDDAIAVDDNFKPNGLQAVENIANDTYSEASSANTYTGQLVGAIIANSLHIASVTNGTTIVVDGWDVAVNVDGYFDRVVLQYGRERRIVTASTWDDLAGQFTLTLNRAFKSTLTADIQIDALYGEWATAESIDAIAAAIAAEAGDGDTAVDHNTGGPDNLAYKTSGGVGIDNATVRAYLKSDYDAGTYTVRGRATTGALGRWVKEMYLNSGETYTFVFEKPGDYGINRKEVEIP